MSLSFERYPNNQHPEPILTPRKDVPWEASAVFNPSVVYEDGFFHMLYRAFPENLKFTKPRGKRAGFYFENNVSSIGYAKSTDGIHFERSDAPFIAPDTGYDKRGCEDPRITKISDTYYITYTALADPVGKSDAHKPDVRIALASTKDFKTVQKHGIIGPETESKAAALFPETVHGGKIGMLLTIAPDSGNSRVSIRYFDSIEEVLGASKDGWEQYLENEQPVLETQWWLLRGPELGASPLKTEKGWLLLFSPESMSNTWTASAALLDLDEPHKLIARAPGYVLQPAAPFEISGLVPFVTFPEGAVVVGENVHLYYGAADTNIGLATCKLDELLAYLEQYKDRT